jgi:hypothetical protein
MFGDLCSACHSWEVRWASLLFHLFGIWPPLDGSSTARAALIAPFNDFGAAEMPGSPVSPQSEDEIALPEPIVDADAGDVVMNVRLDVRSRYAETGPTSSKNGVNERIGVERDTAEISIKVFGLDA